MGAILRAHRRRPLGWLVALVLVATAVGPMVGADAIRAAPAQATTTPAPAEAQSMAVLPDGRVVVLGVAQAGIRSVVVVVRLLPSGALDPTFGEGGTAVLDPGGWNLARDRQALVVGPDGSVTVFGLTTRFPLVLHLLAGRLDAAGRPDLAWGDPDVGPGLRAAEVGQIPGSFPALALAAGIGPGGDPVASVWASTAPVGTTSVYRVDPILELDPRWAGDGRIEGDDRIPAFVDPAGRWIATSHRSELPGTGERTRIQVARRLPGGGPDPAFGTGGVADVLLQPPLAPYSSYDVAQSGADLVYAAPTGFLRIGPGGALRDDLGQGGVVPLALGEPALAAVGTEVVLAGQLEESCVDVHRVDASGAPVPAWAGGGPAEVCPGPGSHALAEVAAVPGRVLVLTTGRADGAAPVMEVTALDATGAPDEGFGGDGTVTVPVEVPPARPALALEAGDRHVTVHFGSSPAAAGYLVAGVQGSTFAAEVVGADTWATSLSGFGNGTPVEVTVLPFTADGALLPSWTASATPGAGAPGGPRTTSSPPGLVRATSGRGFLTVRWGPPPDDGGHPLRGYLVVAQSGGQVAAAAGTSAAARSVSLPGLRNGTTYDVTVVPITDAGFGAPSTVQAAPSSGGPAVGLASAPTYALVAPSGATATVLFGPPADDGGSPIDSHHVLAVQEDPVRGQVLRDWVAVGPQGTRATVRNLVPGQATSYMVLSHTAAGWGAARFVL